MATKNDLQNEIVKEFEKGALRSSLHARQEMRLARQAAERYLRKDKKINIRLSSTDLNLIKRKAAVEGLPYQTLIASVLHKYVSGSIS